MILPAIIKAKPPEFNNSVNTSSFEEPLAKSLVLAVYRGQNLDQGLQDFLSKHQLTLSPKERWLFFDRLLQRFRDELPGSLATKSSSSMAPYVLSNMTPYALPALSVHRRIFHNLEHGSLNKVRAVVLHQTDSASAEASLQAFERQPMGGHFLIDRDGSIYQTARLNKKVWHVGKLRSRCKNEGSCSKTEQEQLQAIGSRRVSFGRKATLISRQELKKKYPDRYPSNDDSLAIEVVGLFDKKQGYGPATPKQQASLDLLLDALMMKYGLSRKDIYPHGKIAYKQPSEGIYLGY